MTEETAEQDAQMDEWEEANLYSEFQLPGEKRDAAAKLTPLAIKDYWSPFDDYPNVEVEANWVPTSFTEEYRTRARRGAPHKHGNEIEHSIGYIKITEDRPIVAVSVLGSGCTWDSYIICEYPQPGITMKEPRRHGERGWNVQTLRRQYVRGLYSVHQSRNVGTFGEDEVTYDGDYEPRVFEASVHFEIEPTTTVTIRGGSGQTCHFSFRMIRVYFKV